LHKYTEGINLSQKFILLIKRSTEIRLFLSGVILGEVINLYLTNIGEILYSYGLIGNVIVLLNAVVSCVVVWFFYKTTKKRKIADKVRLILLGMSLVSLIFAVYNLFVYYSSEPRIVFRTYGNGYTEVLIKGIPIVKVFWSLLLAGFFNIAERFIKFWEERT